MKQPCVYLLVSKRNVTLYVGVTSDLVKRIREGKVERVPRTAGRESGS